MDEESMLKWERKMMASERRALINYLVAETTEKVVKNNEMRVNYFARTSCLVNFINSKANDLIKSQGVTRNFFMPGSCASNKETVNCVCPSVVTDIEQSE